MALIHPPARAWNAFHDHVGADGADAQVIGVYGIAYDSLELVRGGWITASIS